MKTYCGTDIIEVERIKKAILNTPNFKEKMYSLKEIEYADTKSEITRYQYYAGRFAAKEAIYKALSAVFPHIALNEIEVINSINNLNRPVVNILNKDYLNAHQNIQIDVSISHIKEYAIANAVANIA